MKRTTRLLILFFCFSLVSCGHKTKNSSHERIEIDFNEVNVIEIKNNPVGNDKTGAELKQLTTAQSKQFVDMWNSSESIGPCKSGIQYWIFVTFKDGSKRTFRINGQIIKENNDFGYSIKDENFFDNLWKKTNSVVNEKNKTFKLLQGLWLHDEDSLASLTINNYDWTFNYEGQQTSLDDEYQISLTDKLPQFVEESEKAEFIILTNKTDTLHYEILGLDDKALSLMYYPTMKMHLYKKAK